MKTRLAGIRSHLGRLKGAIISLEKPHPSIAKDAEIRASLHRFMAEKSAAILPVRETVFRPEIVIPCFNHGRFLAAALKSVAGAGIPVTVIDDASTDDTMSYVAALGRQYTFTVIQNDANLLQWGCLNKVVSASVNNLFIVLNADDVLLPYSLDLILKTFAARPDIRMLGGSCIPFVDNGILRLSDTLPSRLDYAPSLRLFGPNEARSFARLNDINMTMSSCSFLRSAWEGTGGFKPIEDRVCSYDDRDFQMRVAALFQVAVMEEPLSFYRTTSSLGRAQI